MIIVSESIHISDANWYSRKNRDILLEAEKEFDKKFKQNSFLKWIFTWWNRSVSSKVHVFIEIIKRLFTIPRKEWPMFYYCLIYICNYYISQWNRQRKTYKHKYQKGMDLNCTYFMREKEMTSTAVLLFVCDKLDINLDNICICCAALRELMGRRGRAHHV